MCAEDPVHYGHSVRPEIKHEARQVVGWDKALESPFQFARFTVSEVKVHGIDDKWTRICLAWRQLSLLACQRYPNPLLHLQCPIPCLACGQISYWHQDGHDRNQGERHDGNLPPET